MSSKKNKTYAIIGVIIVCLICCFPYNSKDLLIDTNTILASFKNSIPHSNTIKIDQASFGTLLTSFSLLSNITLPPILLNSFISGIFYGLACFAIVSTLCVYLIFKPKKWLLLLLMQALVICSYIFFEIVLSRGSVSAYIANFIESLITVSLIMLTIAILSTYYPYFIKRFMFIYERKIYTITSVIALFFFALNHFRSDRYAIIIHSITFAFLILTQYLMFSLCNKNRYRTYIILMLSLTIFYSLCFTPTLCFQNMEAFNNAISQLKLLSLLLIAFNIYTNYSFIQKQQKQHKANEVYLSQYVMLLKNYHKLLVEEKHTQVEQVQQKETNSLKDHIQNLGMHLKSEYKLTDREIDVLYLIWDGKTNKEIANDLSITLSTTKYHISNIYLKLNVSSRPQVFALKDW